MTHKTPHGPEYFDFQNCHIWPEFRIEHYFLNDELNLTTFEVVCLNIRNTTRMNFRIFFVICNIVGTVILSLSLNENDFPIGRESTAEVLKND
jgi:hypothetical protein